MNSASTPSESGFLQLDEQTQKDLDLWGDGESSHGLFGYLNLTRTEGGAEALRQRMRQPWRDRNAILATQTALGFIHQQREIFAPLEALAFSSGRVRHYLHDVLPIVVQQNTVEFSLAALSLWANNDRHYQSIIRGVQFSVRFIKTLREFVRQASINEGAGELQPLIAELALLLEGPGLSRVPEGEAGGWPLTVLRLDQAFRVTEKVALSRLLALVHEIDALIALSDVTFTHHLVMPEVLDGPLAVTAENVVHPFVPAAVANPVLLDQSRRVLFLTGPNMAGKTTYLRAVATALYFAHLGMGVPAASFRFVPADQLFSSISLNDDLLGGVSYFRAEALRVKTLAEAVSEGQKVVAIMDEPFKGTNVKDAYDASLAVLERLSHCDDCLFLFSSHLIELNERLSNAGLVDCRYFDARESGAKLQFDYRLREGVSNQRLGMRVLEEEGIFDLLGSGSHPQEPGKD